VPVEIAARMVVSVASIGIMINALEFIVSRTQITEFFDWAILRTKHVWWYRNDKLTLFDWLFKPSIFTTLLVLQACAALTAPVVFRHRLLLLSCCSLVLGIHLLTHFRFIYGFDGADQMQTVIWASLLIYNLADSARLRSGAIAFICAQFVLCYFTSGMAKLISPVWRGGRAVGLIIATESYGSQSAFQAVQRLRLSPFLSWSTIVLEVGGPFLVFLGPKPTVVFLVCSLAFHVGIAVVMGLNTFVWAFVATFPAVYCVSQWMHVTKWLSTRL